METLNRVRYAINEWKLVCKGEVESKMISSHCQKLIKEDPNGNVMSNNQVYLEVNGDVHFLRFHAPE